MRQVSRIIALVVILATSRDAAAEIVFDGSPGSDPPPGTLGRYPMTVFPLDPQPLYEDVTSVASPLGGELGFSIPMNHRRIDQGWGWWGYGYQGDVYYSNGSTAVTMLMPPDTVAFYFYVEQDSFKPETFEAIADDGTTSGPIVVEGSGVLQYFGFYGTGAAAIQSIELTCLSGVDFAVGEFGIAALDRDCPADIAPPGGDGMVDVLDLLAVLGAWGSSGGIEDITGDGWVDVLDLLEVLGQWGPCPADVAALPLAGNPLWEYPYFDFVSAFNEGTTVTIAIDPANVPGGAATADIYIVEAKTEAQWHADPTLEDVRGGPQVAQFSGSTIQVNRIPLVKSDELSSDAGIDIGHGYDLVCDFNQNAVLDEGDLIDGLGDEAGFYVVHDLVALGPLDTTSIMYEGGYWLKQKTWYPADIASMGELPLVIISHGNGHYYTWYDYLQEHLASYGYIVMSHSNNTGPGIETASTTTLDNTDYFLGNLDTIGGGVFEGHVDGTRITWIGHSRGGEGVCRAYDRLFDGEYVPDHYTIDDIQLVSSIAPNDYLGRLKSNPHDVNYHLLIGAADGDNGGWPNAESDAPFHTYERAEGYRQATYVHGADHNDFNCCGWDDFQGPYGTAIGREEAQRVAKAAYLALIKHYIDDNMPARDYLWRQYETLRPLGVDPEVIVDHEYTEGPAGGRFMIDDFQSHTSINMSSSGGAVTGTVLHHFEGQLDDTDGTFTWYTSDPMNGMVRGRVDDLNNGGVFDFTLGADRYLEYQIVEEARDFTAFGYLSFRACQGTRHPETTAELADLDFTVTLRDATGTTSSINFGAYGAGIEEPYQRTGSGSGAGWQNEFETIRIRLTDFLHNASGLDLTQIEALRFDVGETFGSTRGRVGFDDLCLTKD